MEDPVVPVLIALVLIAAGALFGGWLMKRIRQPPVLGELLVGMLVANLAYYLHEPTITVLREGDLVLNLVNEALSRDLSLASAARELLPANPHTQRLIEVLGSPVGPVAVSLYLFIDLLSRIGVIVLLFLVGLETSIREIKDVGGTSLLVAVFGVVCPFLLAMAVLALLFPQSPFHTNLFISALLTATSVAITARVLADTRQSQRLEAKIILGAAVIDDVLGLLILAVVTGIVRTGTIDLVGISIVSLKATIFLASLIAAGLWLSPKLARYVVHLGSRHNRLLVGLSFAFLLSWIAARVGLATIVGAFAAGLILREVFEEGRNQSYSLRELISPIESMIVPVFFVLMGMQVKLETLADPRALMLTAGLAAAAIAGKLLAGLVTSRKENRLLVGAGMVPRGEVGLIFASVGKSLGVLPDWVFSAAVLTVLITTLVTPPLLKLSLRYDLGPAREGSGC
jgi:Kef-type K+ transport system membrane component KefB